MVRVQMNSTSLPVLLRKKTPPVLSHVSEMESKSTSEDTGIIKLLIHCLKLLVYSEAFQVL